MMNPPSLSSLFAIHPELMYTRTFVITEQNGKPPLLTAITKEYGHCWFGSGVFFGLVEPTRIQLSALADRYNEELKRIAKPRIHLKDLIPSNKWMISAKWRYRYDCDNSGHVLCAFAPNRWPVLLKARKLFNNPHLATAADFIRLAELWNKGS